MSPLWTEEMKQKIQPQFEEDDGSFWMGYDDFLQNYYCVNVCKTRNWDEVRIKGKFIKVQEIDDPKIELVMSKWFYAVEIQEKTKVIFGLHQEDERIESVANLRPYMDISIAILKKKGDGSVEIIDFTDFELDRQVEIEYDFEEPGTYIILPRTSGCLLRKSPDLPNERAVLIDRMNNLTTSCKSTISDIFRKFDMLLNRKLSYTEFKGFYECINKTLTEQEFDQKILAKYPSHEKGLSLKGFIEFFKDSIVTIGEETVFSWFESLGYDKS